MCYLSFYINWLLEEPVPYSFCVVCRPGTDSIIVSIEPEDIEYTHRRKNTGC